MEPPKSFPIVSVQSGVRMEETRFKWRIQNFHVVLLHDSLLNTRGVEFSAGESIGVGSKWSVHLSSEEVNGKKWAGLYFTMRERPALKSEFLFVECAFLTRNQAGRTLSHSSIVIKNMYDMEANTCGWGISQFIERDGEDAKEESIVIHVNFKIYSPTVITPPSVEWSLDWFLHESSAKLVADITKLKQFGPLTNIQIVADSNTRVTVQKELLCARSPYFDALMKANTAECIIPIPYTSWKTFRVILTYLGTGILRKEWREKDVLVELTEAAAKFQLAELLNFLDGVIGRVCTLETVGALIVLAKRLSLKRAKEDLLSFVRNQGAASPESFLQILRSVTTPTTREESGLCVVQNVSEGGDNAVGGPPSATITPGDNHSGKRVAITASGNDSPSKMVKRS